MLIEYTACGGVCQTLRAAMVASIMVFAVLATPAHATDKVFIFGDSISDTGNGCFLPFLLAPFGVALIPDDLLDECRDARYFLGRTTQGPVWAEVLVRSLTGAPLVSAPLNQLTGPIAAEFFPDEMFVSSAPPATLGLFGLLQLPIVPPADTFTAGANLAVAGAETTDLISSPDPTLPPELNELSSEIGAFFALAQAGILMPGPADLYVIWIGGNDIRRQIKDAEPVQIEAGVGRILAAIAALQDAVGAERFLVPNLPDVGLSLDLDEDESDLATQVTTNWNDTLSAALTTLESPDVIQLDTFCLTNALIKFARLDTERSCLESNALPACKGLLFFDEIHATSDVHRSFAIGAQAALTCDAEATTGPIQMRRCVRRFTRAQFREGELTLAGRLAINQCVVGGDHPHFHW